MKNVEKITDEILDEKDIIEKNEDIQEHSIEAIETNDEVEVESETVNNVQDDVVIDLENEVSKSSQEASQSTSEKSFENEIESKAEQSENEVEKTGRKHELAVKKKSHKTLICVCISFAIILLLLLLFSIIFALTTSLNSNIINGVSVKDIDVSGLTKEQALEKLSTVFNEKLSHEITLFHNEYENQVFPNQLGVSVDLERSVDIAYNKGRAGNIFQNNYEILLSIISGSKISPSFSFSEETLTSLATEMETNFPDRLVEPSYYVEGNNLVLTKGKDGVVIDTSKLKDELISVINNLNSTNNKVSIPVEAKTASVLDINKIHEEVYRAPQDAYYTTDPYVVYPHVDGIDFSISVDEAIAGYNASEESYIVPLQVLSPNVTTNQIGTEAFPDLLGTFSTTFATSNVNRSTNIRLAASKINGTVVMPGETFSYNQTVGRRTAAAGFKAAAVYSGGEVTTGIGGGICQVSSTLYNSVLLANLDIVERTNHGFNPGYVPAGRDATVSWGGPDFKFKNNRSYPVRVVCSVTGGTILVQIFGLKSEDDYEVEIQSYITSYIQYKTIQKNDASLAKGTTKVLQSGSNGCRSVCYRILKKNGEVFSKTLLSNDTYSPHNKVVAVGTR